MSLREMTARRIVTKAAIRELLVHDLKLIHKPAARLVYAAIVGMLHGPSASLRSRGISHLLRLHGGALSESVDAAIARRIRRMLAGGASAGNASMRAYFQSVVDRAVSAFLAGHQPDPSRLIGSRLLVLKSYRPGEPGVLAVDYSHVFPLLAGLFDLPRIAERYRIVLEPSWTGLCTADILMFTGLEVPGVRSNQRAEGPGVHRRAQLKSARRAAGG